MKLIPEKKLIEMAKEIIKKETKLKQPPNNDILDITIEINDIQNYYDEILFNTSDLENEIKQKIETIKQKCRR